MYHRRHSVPPPLSVHLAYARRAKNTTTQHGIVVVVVIIIVIVIAFLSLFLSLTVFLFFWRGEGFLTPQRRMPSRLLSLPPPLSPSVAGNNGDPSVKSTSLPLVSSSAWSPPVVALQQRSEEVSLAQLCERIGHLHQYSRPLSLAALVRQVPSITSLLQTHAAHIERRTRHRQRQAQQQQSAATAKKDESTEADQQQSLPSRRLLPSVDSLSSLLAGAGASGLLSGSAEPLPHERNDVTHPKEQQQQQEPSWPVLGSEEARVAPTWVVPPATPVTATADGGGEGSRGSAEDVDIENRLESPTLPQEPSVPAVSPSLSMEDVSLRLSVLTAKVRLYQLCELLHEHAERLGYQTYQDPTSNNIIATAATLRAREEAARRYVDALLARLRAMPAAGAAVEDEGAAGRLWSEEELSALERHIMSVLGCNHGKERHCPHRSRRRATREEGRRQRRPQPQGKEKDKGTRRGGGGKPKKPEANGSEDPTDPPSGEAGRHRRRGHGGSRRQRRITAEELAALLGSVPSSSSAPAPPRREPSHLAPRRPEREGPSAYYRGGGATVTIVKPPSAHEPPRPARHAKDKGRSATPDVVLSSLDALNGLDAAGRGTPKRREKSFRGRGRQSAVEGEERMRVAAEKEDAVDAVSDSSLSGMDSSADSSITSAAFSDIISSASSGGSNTSSASEPRISRSAAATAPSPGLPPVGSTAAKRRGRVGAEHDIVVNTFASPNPLLDGYTATKPFTIHELGEDAAQDLLDLPRYMQSHQMNLEANKRHRTCYRDPLHGALVLSSSYLEGFPHCFGEYCTHCPHGDRCWRENAMFSHRRDPSSLSSSSSSSSSSTTASSNRSSHSGSTWLRTRGAAASSEESSSSESFPTSSAVSSTSSFASAHTAEGPYTAGDSDGADPLGSEGLGGVAVAGSAGRSAVYYEGQWSLSSAGVVVHARSIEDILVWELKEALQPSVARRRRTRGRREATEAHDSDGTSSSTATSHATGSGGEEEDTPFAHDGALVDTPHPQQQRQGYCSPSLAERVASLEKFAYLDSAEL